MRMVRQRTAPTRCSEVNDHLVGALYQRTKNQHCVRVTTRQRSPATCVRFATPGQTAGGAPGGKFAENEMEASPGEAADHWILALILLTFCSRFPTDFELETLVR